MKLLRILALLLAVLALPLSAQAKIFLADTDDTLRVVTASGVSTIHMYAAWADITTTALTPGASDAQVTTATTTVLVAAPGASTQRQIKGLTIANSHASSSNAVTVEFFDGATATRLIAYTLLAGETLQWNEDVGFRVLDASGQLKGAVVADTEMPAAQSLSGNNIAYPTSAPLVGAVLLCDDGAALDKCVASDNTAHDAVDAGNPLKIGAKASNATSARTPVANNDRTDIYAGIDGVLIMRPYANLEDRVSGLLANTDGASTAVVAAQGAGIRFCATTVIVSNSSATNVTVDLRDGTAGSVLATIPAAANMGGAVVQLPVPLCTTANTALAMDGSAAATTVTVTAIGFKTAL